MKHDYCVCCGNAEDDLYQHHLIPKSLGAGDNSTITLCGECHARTHSFAGSWISTKSLTKAAMSVKKAAGQRVGAIPYGFGLAADNVSLIEIPAEQEAIKLMIQWRGAGLSYAKIAAELGKRGIVTKSGAAKWEPSTIRHICGRSNVAKRKDSNKIEAMDCEGNVIIFNEFGKYAEWWRHLTNDQ